MGFTRKTPNGTWQAHWREPSGAQRCKTLGRRSRRPTDSLLRLKRASRVTHTCLRMLVACCFVIMRRSG